MLCYAIRSDIFLKRSSRTSVRNTMRMTISPETTHLSSARLLNNRKDNNR